jgi:hypothetical protein
MVVLFFSLMTADITKWRLTTVPFKTGHGVSYRKFVTGQRKIFVNYFEPFP